MCRLLSWYIKSDIKSYCSLWLLSLWHLVHITILLTFSFGQSAEIGIDQSELKMLQRRKEAFYYQKKYRNIYMINSLQIHVTNAKNDCRIKIDTT